MQNFVQEGRALNITAPAGGLTSGQPYMMGKLFGVVADTVAAGVSVALWRKGVYILPKTNAQAWNPGDSLYWDSTNLVVTNVNSGSLTPVGYAAAAAANPSATGTVVLAQAAS